MVSNVQNAFLSLMAIDVLRDGEKHGGKDRMSMSLEMRLSEFAENYRNATREEIRTLIDQTVYRIIDMVILERDNRKMYRDLYHKLKKQNSEQRSEQ